MLSKFSLIFVVFLVVSTAFSADATHWKKVAPGIDYTVKTNPSPKTLGFIHAFKINLEKNTLKLALAQDDLFPGETVKFLAERNHALLAVNGGFFTPLWKPIGLRILNGKVEIPLHTTPWWHIFYIKNNHPYIVSKKAYKQNPTMTFAVQGGPRLLSNGKIPHLKSGKDERTALGITRDGQVIILATDNWRIATTNLAQILQLPESQGGFDCIEALNLDGGTSTQLYANIDQLQLNVSSLALITDIVYVVKSSAS